MDATVTAPMSRPDLSAAMTQGNNAEVGFTTENYLLNRNPDFIVYLYNISEQEFTISRPPLIKTMKIPAAVGPNVRKGVDKNQTKYVLATSLPSPILEPRPNVDNGLVDIIPLDGRRMAMDIINPENLGLNQDAVITGKNTISQGVNLGARGVFWSFNGPGASKRNDTQFAKQNKITFEEEPTATEIEAAKKRLEKHYNQIIEEAKAVEVSSPASLSAFLRPEHHAAVEYFGIETSWHGKRSRPMDCPNCGTRIKEGLAFHVVDGELCVIDWDRTVKAGKRTRLQAYEATGDQKFAPQALTQEQKPATKLPSVPPER